MAITNKYRINITMEWNVEADRDSWFNKIKSAVATLKTTNPAPTSGVIVRDEYGIPDRISENL